MVQYISRLVSPLARELTSAFFSIVGWRLSGMVPLPKASCLPPFLREPGVNATTHWDREFYVECFRRPDYQTSPVFVMLSDQDADFRTLYMESLFSEVTHRLLARDNWRVICSRRVLTWE